VMTGRADKRGDVARTITLPKTVEGELAVSITGSNPNRVGSAELELIQPVKALDVKVRDDELQRKDQQSLTVTGLAPGEQVTVRYGGEDLTTTGKADQDGEFTFDFKVGKETGERTVVVVGAAPGRKGEAKFTVKDPKKQGPKGGDA